MSEYEVNIYLKSVTVNADNPGEAVQKAADVIRGDVLGKARSLGVEPKSARQVGFSPSA